MILNKNLFDNILIVVSKANLYNILFLTVHSKKCWVVLTQLWVKYGLTQPLG